MTVHRAVIPTEQLHVWQITWCHVSSAVPSPHFFLSLILFMHIFWFYSSAAVESFGFVFFKYKFLHEIKFYLICFKSVCHGSLFLFLLPSLSVATISMLYLECPLVVTYSHSAFPHSLILNIDLFRNTLKKNKQIETQKYITLFEKKNSFYLCYQN